ncbi:MAG: HPr family phosphocarrier protein [candidate division Zixibacteria bacterium]|nr:HPr family phosphocarrier protein [candidate division Zixibacteria bacterium]
MISKTVKIINKLGLHARPSARVVQVTSRFKSEIMLEKDGVEVNGKSIMGVLMLAAGIGSEVKVTTNGEDEEEALEVVSELLASNFEIEC